MPQRERYAVHQLMMSWAIHDNVTKTDIEHFAVRSEASKRAQELNEKDWNKDF